MHSTFSSFSKWTLGGDKQPPAVRSPRHDKRSTPVLLPPLAQIQHVVALSPTRSPRSTNFDGSAPGSEMERFPESPVSSRAFGSQLHSPKAPPASPRSSPARSPRSQSALVAKLAAERAAAEAEEEARRNPKQTDMKNWVSAHVGTKVNKGTATNRAGLELSYKAWTTPDVVFDVIDTDRSGQLAIDELVGFFKDSPLDSEKLEELFQTMDVDGSGEISKEEWRAGFHKAGFDGSGIVGQSIEGFGILLTLITPNKRTAGNMDILHGRMAPTRISRPEQRGVTLRQLRLLWHNVVARCDKEQWVTVNGENLDPPSVTFYDLIRCVRSCLACPTHALIRAGSADMSPYSTRGALVKHCGALPYLAPCLTWCLALPVTSGTSSSQSPSTTAARTPNGATRLQAARRQRGLWCTGGATPSQM